MRATGSAMELSATLSALGLQRYYERFVEHDLDLAMLRQLGTTPSTLRGVLTRILGEVVSEPHHHFVALSITRDVVEVRLRREDLRK